MSHHTSSTSHPWLPVRIEIVIPTLFGLFLVLIGAILVFDAWTPDELVVSRERRRHPRTPRDRPGEALIGVGIVSLGAAFLGRDVWAYRTIAVVLAALLVLWGAFRNRYLLRELIVNRGKLRRGAPPEALANAEREPGNHTPEPPERLRMP